MPIKRYFLGWDDPALPRAVQWLRGQHDQTGAAPGRPVDLSHLLVVVPVAEAGRRLLELLLADGDALVPPQILTPAALPERLYEPAQPLAGDLEARLTRAHTLQHAPRATVEAVVPHPPAAGQWSGWWSLAGQLETLTQDLAAYRLRVADVPRRCAELGVDLMGETRWAALAELEQAYHEALREAGLTDRHRARLEALREGRVRGGREFRGGRCDQEIVLLGMADLNPVLAAMLRGVAGEPSARVHALVQAPEAHAAGFDELGGLRVEYWQRQSVDLAGAQLCFVDRPVDQARAVVQAIADATPPGEVQGDGRLAVDEVTVGLGDETAVESVRRALELAGLPARYAAGRPLGQARPARLLAAMGRFVGSRRFNDFAELLRHPDLERYLQARADEAGDVGDATRRTIEHWLTLLDRYATEHLQGHLDGRWLGSPHQQRRLKALWQQVVDLLPLDSPSNRDASDTRRPLPDWSEPIAAALQTVYGDVSLRRHHRQDEPLIRTLDALAGALREQAALNAETPTTPNLTVAEAIDLTLSRLRDQRLPEPGGEAAIELTGYLHLPLDDAPVTIVTSMNEGAVPSSHTADAFLPDSLRRKLGVADNTRRFARDLLMLQAIVRSRPAVTLLAVRRSVDGEPLAPSRLLLACDQARRVQRIQAFYQGDGDGEANGEANGDRQARRTPMLLSPGERDQFLIPPPLMDEPPLRALRVTAFRDYLACPYRFYLRHVRRLQGLDDQVVEMDALAFGSLAHHVLEQFGRSELTDCERPDDIAEFLAGTLDEAVEQRFGPQRRPAIRLQVEQLRQRFEAFAAQQAVWTAEGWRIVPDAVEQDLEAEVLVDGEPFTITGKIDRIDHHPDLGYRIIDYKTGDSGADPDKIHRRRQDGQLVWVDLQLPLYLALCQPQGVAAEAAPGQVQLGYINLPKKLSEVGLVLAPWGEPDLAEAIERRDGVIRGVRGQRFWPPSDPSDWPDDFTGLCADGALNRGQIIEASTQLSEGGRGHG